MESQLRTFDRIRRINDELAGRAIADGIAPNTSIPFICECARQGCFHPVWVRIDRYAALVGRDERLLAAGHHVRRDLQEPATRELATALG